MKKARILVPAFVVIAVLWHVFISHSMDNAYYDINPLTDVATVKMPSAASFGITDPQEAVAFYGGRELTGVPLGEHRLNNYARQYLDIYAMILPYRVILVNRPDDQTKERSSEVLSTSMLQLRQAERRVFGSKCPEVDSYTTTDGGQMQGTLGVIRVCKPHDCNNHSAVWTMDFSTDKAAGAIADVSEVVVYLGDYSREVELPSALQAAIKDDRDEGWPSPKSVRYVHEPNQ